MGRHVHEARWAYDGAAQGGKKIAFGNTWVVAAVVVRLPFCPSPVALPVLFRLWRGKGTASQVQLAAELLELLAGAFGGREVHGTGDAAFHGGPLVIKGTTWTTRLPSNAVLSGPKPPPTGNRGRPREKGDRIGTCAQAAAALAWEDTVIHVYGKDEKVQIASCDALWYGCFKSAAGQLVLVRDPGSRKPYDLGLFSLDTTAARPWPPSGTPGGGPSSRPTPPASSSSASATPATAPAKPSSAPSRSGSSSRPC